MNTNEFLELLEVHCDGMSRYGPDGLLFYADMAQSLLRNTPTEQNVAYNPATGKLPTLNTRNKVFQYSAPDDCWRIAGVLIEAIDAGSLMDSCYYSDYGLPQTQRSGIKGIERVNIGGIAYVRCTYVRTQDSPDVGNASVIFTENPGETTDVYKWWYYRKATKLLSESITLSIPPPFDYLYLFPATVRLVQGFKDGDFLNAHIDVLKIRNEYMKELNKGEQGFGYHADDRGF